MISLTQIGTFRISNRVAAVAALALMMTTFVGAFDEPEGTPGEPVAESNHQAEMQTQSPESRRLSISLLFFGRG